MAKALRTVGNYVFIAAIVIGVILFAITIITWQTSQGLGIFLLQLIVSTLAMAIGVSGKLILHA